MIAALLVLAHHTIVQFCCSGVTGVTITWMGGAGASKDSQSFCLFTP